MGTVEEEGESNRQNGGPEQTGSDGKRHADLTVRQREHLSGVCERNRTFTGGVEGAEEVHEQADETDSHVLVGLGVGDQSAQTSSKQGPEHLGECEEKETSAAKGVDSPEGGEAEEPVDHTETEGSDRGNEGGHARLTENGSGIEGDDVDSAHLLGKHDGEGGEGGAADTGDGEQLAEALSVVGLPNDVVLDLELGADVVNVTSDLDLVESELAHGFPGILVAALLHVPTRGLRAEVDEDEKRNCGKEWLNIQLALVLFE